MHSDHQTETHACPPPEPEYPISHYAKRYSGSRGADRIHGSTITRWILKGVMTPAGRIRLRARRLGSRWVIAESAFTEFINAMTAATLPAAGVTDQPLIRSPAERRRAADAASRQLEKLGA